LTYEQDTYEDHDEELTERWLEATEHALDGLEKRLGRSLTHAETDALAHRAVACSNAGMPFHAAAEYSSMWDASGHEAPDARTDSGRVELLSEHIEDAKAEQEQD
jgi:hypothetical protein